jgi:hypothetical protein
MLLSCWWFFSLVDTRRLSMLVGWLGANLGAWIPLLSSVACSYQHAFLSKLSRHGRTCVWKLVSYGLSSYPNAPGWAQNRMTAMLMIVCLLYIRLTASFVL